MGNVGRVAASGGDVRAALVKEYGKAVENDPTGTPVAVLKALETYGLADSVDDIANAWATDVLDERESA